MPLKVGQRLNCSGVARVVVVAGLVMVAVDGGSSVVVAVVVDL